MITNYDHMYSIPYPYVKYKKKLNNKISQKKYLCPLPSYSIYVVYGIQYTYSIQYGRNVGSIILAFFLLGCSK